MPLDPAPMMHERGNSLMDSRQCRSRLTINFLRHYVVAYAVRPTRAPCDSRAAASGPDTSSERYPSLPTRRASSALAAAIDLGLCDTGRSRRGQHLGGQQHSLAADRRAAGGRGLPTVAGRAGHPADGRKAGRRHDPGDVADVGRALVLAPLVVDHFAQVVERRRLGERRRRGAPRTSPPRA